MLTWPDLKKQQETSSAPTIGEMLDKKIEDIPLLEGVVQEILKIELGGNKNVKIIITTQDFDNCENNTYEKIIK